MIRVASVALLLVSMLSGSASAECAGVLWAERSGAKAGHEVNTAHATRGECGQAVRVTAESFKKTRPTPKMYQAKSLPYEVYFEDATGSGIRYFCLPDTVDPRGPKGK